MDQQAISRQWRAGEQAMGGGREGERELLKGGSEILATSYWHMDSCAGLLV